MLSYAKKLVNEINIWSKFCKSVQWECVSQWAEEGDTKNRKTPNILIMLTLGGRIMGLGWFLLLSLSFPVFKISTQKPSYVLLV